MTRGTESLEPHGRDARGRGIEQLLAPGCDPPGPQLGAVDHLQELDDPEEMLLVLMVERGDLELEVTGGLRGRHSLLMSVFVLVKSLVDHRFQHFGRAEALAVLLDDQCERVVLLDLAPAQHAADLGIVRLGRRADHDRPLGQRHLGASLGLPPAIMTSRSRVISK